MDESADDSLRWAKKREREDDDTDCCSTVDNHAELPSPPSPQPPHKLQKLENADDARLESPETTNNNTTNNNNTFIGTTLSLSSVPNEILLNIFSFLPMCSLYRASRVNHQWCTLASDNIIWQHVYEQQYHLRELIEEIENDWCGRSYLDGFYTEGAKWKLSLVVDVEKRFANSEDGADTLNDSGSRLLDPDKEVDLEELLNDFGAPLQPGTIVEQYDLIQEFFTKKEYRDAIVMRLGLTDEEIGELHDLPPNFFMKKCKFEYEQYLIYRKNQDAIGTDNGSSILMPGGDDYHIYYDEEGFNDTLKERWLMPICINTGMQRLLRRAGVAYHEPSIVPLAENIMRELLSKLIEEAAKKLEGKTVVYKEENYTGLFDSDSEDQVNRRFKINDLDILRAYEKMFGAPLYFGPVTGCDDNSSDDELNTTDDSDEDDEDENEDDEGDEGDEGDVDKCSDDETEYEDDRDVLCQDDKSDAIVTNNEGAIEGDSDKEEIQLDDHGETEDEYDDDFIDDSELEHLTGEHLGESLQDELIKVSMRVHEEVYGKERTHKEKMYLKNWYGYGPSIFQHAPAPEPVHPASSNIEGDFTYVGKSEKQIIEHDRQEDIAYFGYSLYEDVEGDAFSDNTETEEDDDESEQIDGTEYHLRRLLRQESFRCIEQYFARSI